MTEHILKLGEYVHLRSDIKIHVLRIEPDRVRLGIDAPRCIPIVRKEILNRRQTAPGWKRGAA